MKQVWEKCLAIAGSDWGLKIFSLAFAIGLWLFVNVGQKPAERPFKVPVEFSHVPADVVVSHSGVEEIEVRVMGPPALLSTIQPEQLKVALDLDGAKPGTSTFRLGSDSFNPPRGVRVTRITPAVINLTLEALATRMVAVSVRLAGEPPFGYKVGEVETHPGRVQVKGPEGVVSTTLAIETEPIQLDGAPGQRVRESKLRTDGKPISLTPDRVKVSIIIEEETVTKEFEQIEVRAKDFSGKYQVSPKSVYLRLSGPKRVLGQLALGKERVYLDLGGLKPGQHVVPLSFQLPAGVKVVEHKPSRFQVRIFTAERSQG
jgi:YbbR domain-containing protein